MAQGIIYLYFAVQCFFFVYGENSFTLSDGGLGYCRPSENCPDSAVYTGSECHCQNDTVCCKDSGITRKKCLEYGDYVYADEYGAALQTRRTLSRVSQCRNEAVKLIVGGVLAAPMEFPHMVAIGFGNETKKKFMCGGTLISDQHVLTAAHCNTSRDLGPARWAKLGALSLDEKDDGDAVQEVAITHRILHPRFKPPSKYDDIAIFKLAEPVRMTGHVRPACLNVDPDNMVTNLTATGWGKLAASSTVMSPALMKVHLGLIAGDVCSETYRLDEGGLTLPRGVIKTQMCAGDLLGGKDTCQGDSGGPLQATLATPYCMYNVIAVTSFGKSCALAKSPAIYTRVHHYIPWIESIVWPQ